MARSLKTSLAWTTVGAAAVGLVALVVLIANTTVLHHVTQDLSTAIESMRVADEIDVQLLLHNESRSPVSRAAAHAALMRAVGQSEQLIQTPDEARLVAEMRQAVSSYLSPGAGDDELAAALGTARRLSLLNVEQAREEGHRAVVIDRASRVGGIVEMVLLALGVVAVLVWLRRGPFRQVAALSDAMGRFSEGDLDARAPEEGPRELVIMARTFNATAGALLRARQRQAEYVATAIHDLRTPLAAIQLAVGYVAPDRPMPPEGRLRELIALIARQLVRMNGLIGDVLNATWIEAGELPLMKRRLDVRTIANESTQLFRELAPEHIIELTTPSAPVMFDGDRARLDQVVNNLLSNAVKYSPLGSRVRVLVGQTKRELTITVVDEGEGIAPEDRGRIFDTYQRGSATHHEAPGTSLGLWVSRRVIEAHGGRLEVESRVGHGATFRVVLPADPASKLADLSAETALPLGSA